MFCMFFVPLLLSKENIGLMNPRKSFKGGSSHSFVCSLRLVFERCEFVAPCNALTLSKKQFQRLGNLSCFDSQASKTCRSSGRSSFAALFLSNLSLKGAGRV